MVYQVSHTQHHIVSRLMLIHHSNAFFPTCMAIAIQLTYLWRYHDISQSVEPTPSGQSSAALQMLWRQSNTTQAAALHTYQFCCTQNIASCAAARSERIGSPPCADSEQDSTHPSIQSCSRTTSSVTARLEIWTLQQVTQWQFRQLSFIMQIQQQADLHHFGSTSIRPSNQN